MSDTEPSSDEEGVPLFGSGATALASQAEKNFESLLAIVDGLGSSSASSAKAAPVSHHVRTLLPKTPPVSPQGTVRSRPLLPTSKQPPVSHQEPVRSQTPRPPLGHRMAPPVLQVEPELEQEEQDPRLTPERLQETWATRPWGTASSSNREEPLQPTPQPQPNPQAPGPEVPDQASVRLNWAQVLYWVDANGQQKLNCKDAPCNAPFDGMIFKGYNISKDKRQVEAWFAREGASARRPNRGKSGVNKDWHATLQIKKRTGTPEDVQEFKRTNSNAYVSKAVRTFGLQDPQI